MDQSTTAATSDLPPTDPAVADLIGAIEAFGRAQREIGGLLARSIDIPRASISILRYLHVNGSAQIGCIAHHLRVDLSVASRQISTIVDAGLVRRTIDDGDRRARTIDLTPEGHEALSTIRTHITHLLGDIFAEWDTEQIQAAVHHISALAETVAAYDAASEQTSTPTQPDATHQNSQSPKDNA
ncbi:MarR family winged helix-turn-helix transcriptional regulator [Sanguibacter antarcticus]|uniref:MarR family transcriptional regulator n=1 Tax=Sanguibacter antarcticus TaxID=372484 RepID=A0A2A9E8G8_9MICO|nr:MarR family winged helix-turn-helix transcriptional regulator [Sanguibacter antarcticus]PFG35133.1 MarR family transcriptional regulator [Sanguibacter antarcticus]